MGVFVVEFSLDEVLKEALGFKAFRRAPASAQRRSKAQPPRLAFRQRRRPKRPLVSPPADTGDFVVKDLCEEEKAG